jgi:hypothetical protein
MCLPPVCSVIVVVIVFVVIVVIVVVIIIIIVVAVKYHLKHECVCVLKYQNTLFIITMAMMAIYGHDMP